jgi:hypothetical protein
VNVSRLAAGIVLAAAAELVSPGIAAAQGMTKMTPEAIREASAWGSREKTVKPYVLKRTSHEFGICEFLTPYLRVAEAASLAAKENKPLDEAGAADLVSGIVLYGRSTADNQGNRYVAVDVTDLWVVKAGQTIRPTKKERVKEYFHGSRVSFRGTIEAYGMRGVFPEDVVGPDTEVVVSYSTFDSHNLPKTRQATFRFESKPYK